jgi:SAM-dependent methyltransferase
MSEDWRKWEPGQRRTARFFSDRCDSFSSSFEAANWGSQQGQRRRFEVLSGIADLHGETVLDVGCGQGDYASYLLENGIIPRRFVGIDLSDRMIEIASARDFKPIDTEFYCSSFHDFKPGLGEYDYVFASGIFYRVDLEPYEFLERTVELFYRSAGAGTAFNTLFNWGGQGDSTPEGGEFLAQPERLLDIVRRITSRFVLRCDYHPRDLTFYLYKQEEQP